MGFTGKFVEGLTTAVLIAGGRGALGPMWNLDDQEAKNFALKFYDHALAGSTIGEAVRLARLDIRNTYAESDVWKAWVLYGNPLSDLF